MILEFLEKISNPLGLMGVMILLVAYFSLSIGKLSSRTLTYQMLNGLGASLILFSLLFRWNTPAALIEIAWIIISIIGIVRTLRSRRLTSSHNIYTLGAKKKIDLGKL